MTVVNPKSISGINSITTGSGSDDILTIHTNNGTERLRVDSTGATKIVTGIVTTLTATTGIVTTLTANTVTSLGAVSGTTGTFSGAVSGTTGSFTGNVAISGANITLPDSGSASDDRLVFGNGSDLSIFHDGTHSRIYNSTGNLSIRSAVFDVLNADGSERMMRATADGGCDLFFNGISKLETRVGDTIFHDDIRIQDNNKINIGTADDLQIYHDATHSYIKNSTNSLRLSVAGGSDEIQLNKGAVDEYMARFIADGAVELYHNGTKQCETSANGLAFPSGKGIDFSATSGTPSNGGEILDDYEEGDFTPNLGGITNYSSYNITGDGHYVKIGKVVHVNIQFNNKDLNDSASGRVMIYNLPFAPFITSGNARGVSTNYMSYNVTHDSNGFQHSWFIDDTYGSFMGLITKSGASWDNWGASNFTASGMYLDFQGTYFTAA